VARILDAVDRGNPCRKRDYAIILLVARHALRGIDDSVGCLLLDRPES
jgi:hypothetical protein